MFAYVVAEIMRFQLNKVESNVESMLYLPHAHI